MSASSSCCSSSPTSSTSVSSSDNVAESIEQSQRSIDAVHEEIFNLRHQLQQKYQEPQLQQHLQKSFHNLEESMQTSSNVVSSLPPSERERKRFEVISPQIRALIADKVLYSGEMTWEQAMVAYKVSRSTIARIVKEEKSHKGLDKMPPKPPPKRRGRRSPLTMEAIIGILIKLEQESTLSLVDFVNYVKDTFNISTSTSAIDRKLQAMDITWKNVVEIPVDWNTSNTIQQRITYIASLSHTVLMPKVFLGETGFNMHLKKGKGRALAGEKATLTVMPKGQRISLIAALDSTGIVHHVSFNSLGDKKRGVNAEDFRSFLIDLSGKVQWNSVFILDNCKIHDAELLEGTWHLLRQTYGIEHIFLPPYSPFLNPIEYAFNDLKAAVKQQVFYNRGELLRTIEEEIKNITAEKSQAYYSKTLQYHEQVLLGLPFQGKPLQPSMQAEPMQESTADAVGGIANALVPSVVSTNV